MDSALLATLTVHNPWLQEPTRQRALLEATLPQPFVPRVKPLDFTRGQADLVVGPRQAGKSTWVRSQLADRDAPVLLLHAEEPRVREICASAATAISTLAPVLNKDTILYLEEVQHLHEAPLFIKGLVDLDQQRRMVATGSASFALRTRIRESLAGRAKRTFLAPFSLEEVAQTVPSDLLEPVRAQRLNSLWRRLVVYGGYPRPWLLPEPERTLLSLVEAFVLRDTSDFYAIEYPGAFRKLLELAAADVGNLVNVTSWASLAGVSRGTAERYLSIAEEAHLLRLVPPFIGGKRAEVTGRPKIYFVDNGLRNAVFGGFVQEAERGDRGALWENAVFGELLKRLELLDDLRYWRTKGGAEVDFVIRRQDRVVALEVKASGLRRPTVSRAARSFLEAYRPVVLGVIHSGERLDAEISGVPVRFRRPWEIGEILGLLAPA